MNIKWISIILVVAFLLFMHPLTAEAGRTRVYISISVGGAVIVGGAFIAWSLTYGTRVSKKDPGPNPLPSVAYSVTGLQGQRSMTSLDRFLQSSPERFLPFAFEHAQEEKPLPFRVGFVSETEYALFDSGREVPPLDGGILQLPLFIYQW